MLIVLKSSGHFQPSEFIRKKLAQKVHLCHTRHAIFYKMIGNISRYNYSTYSTKAFTDTTNHRGGTLSTPDQVPASTDRGQQRVALVIVGERGNRLLYRNQTSNR